MAIVFVTGTGRCGSCTFYHLASTLSNYRASHEKFAGEVHDFAFEDGEIYVIPQLVYAIPVVKKKYPDAKWVHLIRKREACVRSLMTQCRQSMEEFRHQWFLTTDPEKLRASTEAFYDLTNAMCIEMLPEARTMHIENISEEWPGFCEWIGGSRQPDLEKEILGRLYNPGENRGRDNFVEREKT